MWSQPQTARTFEAPLKQTARFLARHMVRLEQSQQGLVFGEKDPYLSQRAQPGPLYLRGAGRRILSPSALPFTYHSDTLSNTHTRTLTSLQPASDDAPQPMRFPPSAEPSPPCVFFAREEAIGVL